MKQYTKDNVENSLKDLNGVDFWWILATNTKEFPGIFDSIHEGQKAISKKAIRKLQVSNKFSVVLHSVLCQWCYTSSRGLFKMEENEDCRLKYMVYPGLDGSAKYGKAEEIF
ncbi:hypothetical protein P5673_017453 [Acropora cervicornis]|uniref:Uncharacterized protein n=1 Tax=Acropora cervicornis TaxID=6130 RepID=A0AAD9QEK7_ACRCE|nr:hypothetical protein P5673_017453 [Acropora cervicornis]